MAFPIPTKVIILGNTSVGKTSLLRRLLHGPSAADSIDFLTPTIGVDLQNYRVTLKCGLKVDLQIWDTAGQERFQIITRQYYRGAQGVIFVYDVSNRQSYVDVHRWVQHVNETHGNVLDGNVKSKNQTQPVFFLLANKIDLAEEKFSPVKVLHDDGTNLHHMCDMTAFFEVSAKTGKNVDNAFQHLAFCLVNNWNYRMLNDSFKIKSPCSAGKYPLFSKRSKPSHDDSFYLTRRDISGCENPETTSCSCPFS